MNKIRLQPFVSPGETIQRADGAMEVVPMQLVPLRGGGAVLRIGNSAYWFNEDGSYDGPEHSFPDRNLTKLEGMEIGELLEGCKDGRGQAPDEPYFDPGTRGWRSEVAGWPPEARRQQEAIAESRSMDQAMSGKPLEQPRLFTRRFRKSPKN